MLRSGAAALLFWCLTWSQLLISESSSADHELRLFPPRDSSRLPPPRHRPDHLNPPRHVGRVFGTHLHHGRPAGLAKAPPSALLGSGGQRGLTLLERPHAAVSARHLVTVYLAVDVRRLNVSLLRWFGEGVAAALGVPAEHVHINRLNEEKNSIELFVSSDRPGISEPRPAEEVIRSLNVRVLHRHLGHFGITEVSSEKNVLQGEQRDHVWTREGFYTVVLFFTVFVIVVTCLMVLYRLKEKVQVSETQLKAPPPDLHLTPNALQDYAQRSKGTKVCPQVCVCSSVCG